MTQEAQASALYVRAPSGAVHSVAPGAEIPEGWDQLTEEEARIANPPLFGKPDPAVTFCEMRG